MHPNYKNRETALACEFAKESGKIGNSLKHQLEVVRIACAEPWAKRIIRQFIDSIEWDEVSVGTETKLCL